jgi:hypothetical protein
MRIGFLWPLGIILLGLLSGPSCEDDPTDLDYLKKGAGSGGASAGTNASGTTGSAGKGSADTAGASAGAGGG